MAGFSIAIFMSILYFMYLFFIAIFVGFIIYLIISYTFESISIMCMEKQLQYKHKFIAWIPFYNKYLLGTIAGNKAIGIISCILSFVSILLSTCFYIYQKLEIILFIILIISIIVKFILDTIMSHKIYKERANKYSDILTIFTILSFGLLRPIFLFIVRNKPVNINNNIYQHK